MRVRSRSCGRRSAADPCQRTGYAPGEFAQRDMWQPNVETPLGFDHTDKSRCINQRRLGLKRPTAREGRQLSGLSAAEARCRVLEREISGGGRGRRDVTEETRIAEGVMLQAAFREHIACRAAAIRCRSLASSARRRIAAHHASVVFSVRSPVSSWRIDCLYGTTSLKTPGRPSAAPRNFRSLLPRLNAGPVGARGRRPMELAAQPGTKSA